jgi:hypothetical protein
MNAVYINLEQSARGQGWMSADATALYQALKPADPIFFMSPATSPALLNQFFRYSTSVVVLDGSLQN